VETEIWRFLEFKCYQRILVMENYIEKHPVELSVLLIGCSPRFNAFVNFDDDINQIYPLFLRKNTTDTIRVFCIDPALAQDNNPVLIDTYFKSLKFSKSEFGYKKPNVEIVIIPKDFYDDNEDDIKFLKFLMNSTLLYNSKLIIQRFTGNELYDLSKNMFRRFTDFEQSELINNVLFDLTYGYDCHCSTPMSKYEPIYLNDGAFFNLMLYKPCELITFIGVSEKIDGLILQFVKKIYSSLIDLHHINYRRRNLKEPLGNYSYVEEYNDSVTGEEIMRILKDLLLPQIEILNILTKPSETALASQKDLLENYKNYEIYKWYTTMKQAYTTTSTPPPNSNI